MKCHDHPETEAIGVCALCGHPLCGVCAQEDEQAFYCASCRPELFAAAEGVAAPAYGVPAAGGALPSPPVARVPVRSAGTAAFLSVFMPFSGQIYNDQPAKAAAFLLLFASCLILTWRAHPLEGLFGGLATLLYFYQIFDAYRTARGGVEADEPAFAGRGAEAVGSDAHPSPVESRAAATRREAESPFWGMLLILLGTAFLLDNLQFLQLEETARFWPLLLIGTGALLVHAFFRPAGRPAAGERQRLGLQTTERSGETHGADY